MRELVVLQNQNILNTRNKSLFSEVCDWEVHKYLLGFSVMYVMVRKRMGNGKKKKMCAEFQLQTWIKEIQTLKQVTQKSCGIFIPTDVLNPSGHDPGKSALGDAAFPRLIGWDHLNRCLMTSSTVRFCENQWIPEFRITNSMVE